VEEALAHLAHRTTTEGSVMGGGVIRETVTPLPAQPAPAR
jgi:hypothetical protein